MQTSTELDFVWSCDHAEHQHPTWEGAERCGNPLDPHWEQLQRATTKLALSCLRALDALRPLLPPDHERARETRVTILGQLRTQYEHAGMPYGRGESGMWRWVRERAAE
jgi:hypothetical protein